MPFLFLRNIRGSTDKKDTAFWVLFPLMEKETFV